jgi:RNA polymerase sigma-70 factor (ECF subfamily)
VIETSRSLLERLCRQPDAAAWRRLVDLYTPLIRRWLRQCGLPAGDTDDLVQEVLSVVVRKMPEFRPAGHRGAFRRWLRTIAVHKTRDYWRSRRTGAAVGGGIEPARWLEELEDPHSEPNRFWDREHDRFLAARVMELVQPEFTLSTWQAFRRQVIDGARAAEVAAELGISPNAALIAKSRVLRRLREEIRGLTDE